MGASADEAPTSPPVARRWMTLISLGSSFGAVCSRQLMRSAIECRTTKEKGTYPLLKIDVKKRTSTLITQLDQSLVQLV